MDKENLFISNNTNKDLNNCWNISHDSDNKRLSVSDLKIIPWMDVSSIVGFSEDLKRVKIDVFGLSDSGKTKLIRNIVYGTDYSPSRTDQDLIKYIWNPIKAEHNQDEGDVIQIDLWDIPNSKLYNYEIFCHLSENGMAIIVLRMKSALDELSSILRRFFLMKKVCTIMFVATDQDNLSKDDRERCLNLINSSVKATQTELLKLVPGNICDIKIILPPFAINLSLHSEISDFKINIVNTLVSNKLVKYTAELSMLHSFLQQLRKNDNIYTYLGVLRSTFLSSFKCPGNSNSITDNLRCLETLGEIFIIPCIDNEDFIVVLQPLKYMHALEILISKNDDRMFKLDSRRFWPQKSLRPDPQQLATVISKCIESRCFYDNILPIMWQNLQLVDAQLSQINDVLLLAGVIIRPTDVSREYKYTVTMPEYPSFCRGVRYRVVDYTTDIHKPNITMSASSTKFQFSLKMCYQFSQLATMVSNYLLICCIANKIVKINDNVQWLTNGFSYQDQWMLISIESNSLESLEIYCNYDQDSESSLNQVATIVTMSRNFLTNIFKNLKYVITGTITNNRNNASIHSLVIDDENEAWRNVIKEFMDKSREEAEDIEEVASTVSQSNQETGEKPLIDNSKKSKENELVESKVLVSMPLEMAGKGSQVTTQNSEISPFDLRRSKGPELENVIYVKRGTAAEQLSYLKHIASSYIAVIFIQAAVEVISLQVDDQHKSINRDPLVVAAQRDLMSISTNIANNIHSGDYETSGKIVLKVANAVQRAIKRTDQYNNPTKSRFCSIN